MSIARLILVATALGVCTPVAEACGYQPERLKISRIREVSDVVVKGQLTYSFSDEEDLPFGAPDWLVGNIAAQKIMKGIPAESYPIRHSVMQFYCSGAGWEPDRERPKPTYSGDFYLRRTADNHYVILGYRP